MRGPMRCRAEHGAALGVCLILLLVLTLVGLTAARLAAMELRMAAGDEMRVDALEQAQSLVDGAIANPANTAALSAGAQRCARAEPGCTDDGVVLPAPLGLLDGSSNVAIA